MLKIVAFNFIKAIAQIINASLTVYMWIIILRALVSWFSPDPRNMFYIILYRLTEPVLRPFRRFLPPYRLGGLDISPFLVILVIIFINNFLVGTLIEIASRMK
ncbi:MAG: YggT family protein [Candidatus Aminicenantia bacterium]